MRGGYYILYKAKCMLNLLDKCMRTISSWSCEWEVVYGITSHKRIYLVWEH